MSFPVPEEGKRCGDLQTAMSTAAGRQDWANNKAVQGNAAYAQAPLVLLEGMICMLVGLELWNIRKDSAFEILSGLGSLAANLESAGFQMGVQSMCQNRALAKGKSWQESSESERQKGRTSHMTKPVSYKRTVMCWWFV